MAAGGDAERPFSRNAYRNTVGVFPERTDAVYDDGARAVWSTADETHIIAHVAAGGDVQRSVAFGTRRS